MKAILKKEAPYIPDDGPYYGFKLVLRAIMKNGRHEDTGCGPFH